MENVRFVEPITCMDCMVQFKGCKNDFLRAMLVKERHGRQPCRGCKLLNEQGEIVKRQRKKVEPCKR